MLSEADQQNGLTVFDPLPSVGPALRELATALERVGAVPSGNVLLDGDRDAFVRRWQDLHLTSGPDEPLVVHFTGHGDVTAGVLYLATSGADPADLPWTAVSVSELINQATPGSRPVLLVLDVCGAGQAVTLQQLADLAARRTQDEPRKVWIIAACGDREITSGARFTTATAEVLHRLADHELDINPALPHVPVTTLATAIHRHLARTDATAGHRQHVVHTPRLVAHDDDQPAFLPNPDHTPHPHTALLTAMNPLLREFALASAPGLDPLHFATRAAGNPTANAIHFSGRHSQLARIQQWIDRPPGGDGPRMLVVTGGPGSGKSALLGVTACLTHPRLEPIGDLIAGAVDHFDPRQPATVLAVHARQLTLQQIAQSLHRQWRGQHPDPGLHPDAETAPPDTHRLVEELAAADDVLLVLDALDEAIDPATVCRRLLLPLAAAAGNRPGCRILLGTRPWWDTLAPLRTHLDHHPGSELDLDPATEDDRRTLADDLNQYLRRLLPRRHPRQDTRRIADHLAQHAESGAFLVANLYADHLRTTPAGTDDPSAPPQQPPTTITDVFDLHAPALAANDPWVAAVLAAAGQGHGDGLPLELLHHVALAHQPPGPGRAVPQPADTRRALRKAAFYLRTTPGPDQRLLYRYFHQALTDHTRPRVPAATVHQALLATVPTTSDGIRNWELADPYLHRHAAAHAVSAGHRAFDDLLEDPAFLVHAEPDTLGIRLHHATTEQTRLNAHIYRTTTAHHPDRHRPGTRRSLLSLDAASSQQPHLAEALARTPVDNAPAGTVPRWATNLSGRPARLHTLTGHTADIQHLATTTVPDNEGRILAVTTDGDGTAAVWNLHTGERLHTRPSGASWVLPVATTPDSEGRVLAATPDHGGIAVWNVHTGEHLHTLNGASWLMYAATTAPDGTLFVATDHGKDACAIWNATTGEHLHTLTGSRRVLTLATAPDGRLLAVTAGHDHTAIVWNATTGERLHTLTGHTDVVLTATTAFSPDGRLLLVTAGRSRTAIIWNATTGEHLHTLTGHTDRVWPLATATTPDGRLLLATAGDDDTDAIVWNATTGEHLHTLTGHIGEIRTMATVPDGAGGLLLVTAGIDHTAIVWNATTGERLHTLTGHTEDILAVATATTPEGKLLVVTASEDHTVVVWDLNSGEHLHTLTGHTHDIRAMAAFPDGAGGLLAVTAGMDHTAIVWNATTGKRLHTLTGHTGWVEAVAMSAAPDGRLLAVTAGDYGTQAIVWDATTGERLHTLTGHTGRVKAVAMSATPDGRLLAVTAGHRSAVVWNATTGEHLYALVGDILAATTVPDGRLVVITNNDARSTMVWNAATGMPLSASTGPTKGILAMTNTSEGHLLAVSRGTDERSPVVWDLHGGKRLHTLRGHTASVESAASAATPDGRLLVVTAGRDHRSVVWDVTTGERLHTLTGHTGRVEAVATTVSDGRLLAVTAGDDRTAIVWNLHTGREIARCRLKHPAGAVTATPHGFLVSYGPDVAYFAFDFT
ncbi:AAA family ATPase [Kitasatospora herbaricolor]|uniref:AAA family ATPase n=1 Tax=Kitasatospora herbaricolor TaxID=68217 RepID=UPI0036DA3D78